MGPAGVTMVIIRDNIIGKINRHIPTMLDYNTHINKTLSWLKGLGGVAMIENINKIKAEKLYREIDRNSIFKCPVYKEDRSQMNVLFIFTEKRDKNNFLQFCADRGLMSLKGHRSVGGFRASIYNAMPLEGIDALVAVMQDYESLHSK